MLYSILSLALALVVAVPAGAALPVVNDDYDLPKGVQDVFAAEHVQQLIDRYREQARDIAKASRGVQEQAIREEAGNNAVIKAFAEHIRQSLGIDPDNGQLYVFVSMSMGDNMIRSYLQEGAWAGAQVVVRGIPAGMTLKQYMVEVMRPLVQGRPGAGIRIDPRLFDLYGVDAVPTIVWQPGRRALCHVSGKTPRRDAQGEMQPVPVCEATNRDYWKVEGAVTIGWALELFDKEGAKGAGQRLAILRKNVGIRQVAQKPFEGDWSQARLPGQKYNPAQPNKNPVLNYTRGVLSVPEHTSPSAFQQ